MPEWMNDEQKKVKVNHLLSELLFLKMADEYGKPPHNKKMQILKELSWESLIMERGAKLEDCYTKILRELGKTSGILGQIFTKSQNKIQDPANQKLFFQLFSILRILYAEVVNNEKK